MKGDCNGAGSGELMWNAKEQEDSGEQSIDRLPERRGREMFNIPPEGRTNQYIEMPQRQIPNT